MPRLYGGEVTTRSMLALRTPVIPSTQSPDRRSKEVTAEFDRSASRVQGVNACHPEAGAARRGTSHAVSRLRETNRHTPSLNAQCFAKAKIATARSLGALRQPRNDSAFNA